MVDRTTVYRNLGALEAESFFFDESVSNNNRITRIETFPAGYVYDLELSLRTKAAGNGQTPQVNAVTQVGPEPPKDSTAIFVHSAGAQWDTPDTFRFVFNALAAEKALELEMPGTQVGTGRVLAILTVHSKRRVVTPGGA